MAYKFARLESSWLQRVALLQEVYKIRITDLKELKQWLRTDWAKLDHVVIAAAICQWHRWYLQIHMQLTKKHKIHTHKHKLISVPSVTKPNPENCKNCSPKCAYDCATSKSCSFRNVSQNGNWEFPSIFGTKTIINTALSFPSQKLQLFVYSRQLRGDPNKQ